MQHTKFAQGGAALAVAALVVVLAPLAAFAYTGVERTTDTTWKAGTVVSADSGNNLVAASVDKSDYIGIVAQDSAGKTVEIAESGTVSVLVTDTEGSITAGGRVGLSSVAGVASAWTAGVAIGVVQDTPSGWENATLSNGKEARVARANVQLLTDGTTSGSSPVSIFFASLEKTASGIAGKPVDTWRVVTALLIALGGLILAFGLLFISSRESFFSMGRNPMASTVIMHGLWKIAALSIAILSITLLAAYLIVRIG